MCKVEVVDAHDQGGQPLAILQRLGQGAHEGGLAYPLDPVQPYDKRAWIVLPGMLFPVLFYP